MDLGEWNRRLAEHFDALARSRKDFPLFALEHGLATAEVHALSEKLRADIRVSAPVGAHALVWVVYAAEIGYRYAGYEYWQTFETETPGWTNDNRPWLRNAFVAFQKRFGAASPSGRWAGQFKIIAWPITHAILPRDLQQQLARILFELRHSFSAELFDEPQRLGEFIAARSWNASGRFQNLVRAPALVGQIAAALLLQGEEGRRALIHSSTLKRISDDVDRERRGRDWLRGARRAAKERARIRGLSIGKPMAMTSQLQRRDEARAEIERLGIEPRVVLRPIGSTRWDVSVEIPDLSHLLLRFPQVREVLTESRCTVAGAAGRPLARGRCLHGAQRVALSRWPRPDEVLLMFERTDPQLEYLLRAECMLRPGSSGLFRVASDGLAYESRGMRVRAATKYLLVSTEPITDSHVTRAVELTCEGVHAVLLDVPPTLTHEWEQTLRQLRITQAKSIEVWPAGLAAVAWDGEGHGEWLASETPTLAIRSDHVIDELTIAMGDGPSLSLAPIDTPLGEPVFIELPPLPVGLHKVSVAARTGKGAGSEVIGDLDVVMRVREARPWSAGASTHGPIDVELDPGAPSLEQLWEGKASIVVRGPAGRRAKCRVKMFVRAREDPSFERELPPVTLPLSNEDWVLHLETHLKKQQDAARSYDAAHFCEVEFSAYELGVITVRCEREFAPLRWSLRKNKSGFVARLHDNADSGAPVIERYSFERPTEGERLSQAAEYQAPPAGGLYAATLPAFKAMIIVPPIVKDFAGLRCEPSFKLGDRSPARISQLLSFARLWAGARLSGDPIGGARQRTVIRAITAHVFAMLGGQSWERAENNLAAPNGLAELKRSISHKPAEAGIGAALNLNAEEVAAAAPGRRAEKLASLAQTYRLVPPSAKQREFVGTSSTVGVTVVRRVRGVGPERPAWLAEFALRLASDPTTLEAWAGEHVNSGIQLLLDAPTLARAARFFVLAVDQHQRSIAAAGEFYAGWRWSA